MIYYYLMGVKAVCIAFSDYHKRPGLLSQRKIVRYESKDEAKRINKCP